ncbi:DUF5362 family protein [Prosthecobacter vanneervenii]|uniref:GYF domain-containing protein n=1 Tax=Prosthecobacter vanneervenii TaxID=48466 RepID=A0A7W7YBB8_9BACT|nr:DUF5362 family protein [Prosthecobacter vanneervenii]MBB5032964.1 hypothetical protein [Prosthecobacter vanneervenii]
MMSYLVTREGQELGTFKTSKIEKGLKTGFFRVSDLAWHEASGWQGLFEIVGSDKAAASASGASLLKSAALDLPLSARHRAASCGVVAPAVLAALSATRPWVRFIAAMMGIGCGLVLAAWFALVAEGAHATGNRLALGALSALLSLYPALKLTQYAMHIERLVKSQSHADLAAALTEQRLFWKFHGILLVVFMVLLFLLIVAGSGFIGQGLF